MRCPNCREGDVEFIQSLDNPPREQYQCIYMNACNTIFDVYLKESTKVKMAKKMSKEHFEMFKTLIRIENKVDKLIKRSENGND